MSFQRLTASVSFAVLAGAVLSQPAWAATPQEVADALVALLDTADADLTYDMPVVTGGEVTISNISARAAGGDEGEAEIGRLTLVGGDLVDGNIVADVLRMENTRFSGEGSRVSIDALTVNGLRIPQDPDTAAPPSMANIPTHVEATGISIETEDEPAVTMTDFTVDFSGTETSDEVRFAMAMNGLTVSDLQDLAALDEDDSARYLVGLGYDQLSFNFATEASWTRSTGELAIENLTVEAPGLGSLSASLTLGGITEDLMNLASGDSMEAAAFAAASVITLDDFELRFEDDSITRRILEQVATERKVPVEDLVQQLVAAIPALMLDVENPPLREALGGALATFIQNPQSFAIRFDPPEALPLLQLYVGGSTDPEQLLRQLGLTISANGTTFETGAGPGSAGPAPGK